MKYFLIDETIFGKTLYKRKDIVPQSVKYYSDIIDIIPLLCYNILKRGDYHVYDS